VAARISRRQNYERLDDNLRFLRQQTGVYLHADLIAGLPGESVECFGAGFDRLVALGPQEIQVGILKRLRGAPIARHDLESRMVYAQDPPYEILCNDQIDFATMQRLRRFARYWDIIGNSGNFLRITPMLWRDASPFRSFLELTDALYERLQRTDSISLATLGSELFRWVVEKRGFDAATVANAMLDDYRQSGRAEVPEYLRPYLAATLRGTAKRGGFLPKRQSRHLTSDKLGEPKSAKQQPG